MLAQVREIICQRSSLCFWVFTTAIGAHSISKEVAVFSPLWFPRGKSFCLLSLVIIVVHVILLDNILRSYFLNDKNLTLLRRF